MIRKLFFFVCVIVSMSLINCKNVPDPAEADSVESGSNKAPADSGFNKPPIAAKNSEADSGVNLAESESVESGSHHSAVDSGFNKAPIASGIIKEDSGPVAFGSAEVGDLNQMMLGSAQVQAPMAAVDDLNPNKLSSGPVEIDSKMMALDSAQAGDDLMELDTVQAGGDSKQFTFESAQQKDSKQIPMASGVDRAWEKSDSYDWNEDPQDAPAPTRRPKRLRCFPVKKSAS